MDWAVLLAGGSGTRFWPLSSPTRPKQLLPLAGPRSTAEETVARLEGLIPPDRVLIVAGGQLAGPLQRRLSIPFANYLVEPRPASTAPALVWATFEARRRDPDATILSLHADWVVPDPAPFVQAARAALQAARAHDRLVTVGVVPTRVETGYGYIVPGSPLGDACRRVARFTEKPDVPTATRLLAEGALWNTGLFAWTAERFLAEARVHTQEVAPALPRLDRGDVAGFFREVRDISIDVGLLERSAAVAVITADFAWDDVGGWDALARVRPADAAGNVLAGTVTPVDAAGCIAWSDGIPIVLAGVRDLVVVEANGRILVLDRARAADLKQILARLPPEVRDLPA